MPREYTEENAVREVDSWGFGIEFNKVTKVIIIPKSALVGLRRLGALDFLSSKCNWMIIRKKS